MKVGISQYFAPEYATVDAQMIAPDYATVDAQLTAPDFLTVEANQYKNSARLYSVSMQLVHVNVLRVLIS